ncbi:MAG: imidazolonepropionase, partial [Candidatus Kapaibacterium sp.]
MGLVAFKEICSVLTMRSSSNRLSGSAMNDIGVLRNAAIVFDEQIRWVGSMDDYVAGRTAGEWSNVGEISLKGHCVMPGFVDSHTHIVFAGSRATEYGRRLQGVSYQQIASEGGGILSTMRAVRDSSVEELADMGIRYALSAMKYGTTTIEI